MNNLYLSRIQFENFRTFGNFSLDLPAGPGLTLVVGTNGLGKSSFFDGLEWGLTGEIRRFNDYLRSSIAEAAYLKRRDAKEDSYGVSLTFGSGSTITRTSKLAPPSQSIIDLLKKDGWASIENLSTYLAFTHFLGQAAHRRFTSRQSNEQWESLKGPSGIDRLEEIRSALRGPSTRNAFKRIENEQSAAVVATTQKLTEWRDASLRLKRLRQVAKAAGDLSGADLEGRVVAIEGRLKTLVPEVTTETAGEIGDRIASLRENASKAVLEVERQQAALSPLPEIIQQFSASKAASDPDGLQAGSAANSLEQAIGSEALAARTVTITQGRLEQLSSRIATIAKDVVALNDGLVALEQIALLQPRLTATEVQRRDIAKNIDLCNQRRAAANSLIAAQSKRSEGIASAASAEAAAKLLVDGAIRLQHLELHRQTVEQAVVEAEKAAEYSSSTLEKLKSEANQNRLDIDTNEALMVSGRKRASEIAAAVVRIANHLTEHDKNCPVCSTEFEFAKLKSLAENAAINQETSLIPLESRRTELNARATQIAKDIATHQGLLAAVEQQKATLRNASATLVEQQNALRPSLGTGTTEFLIEQASKRHKDAIALLEAAKLEFQSATPAVSQAKEELTNITGEIVRLNERLTETDRFLSSLRTSMRTHTEAQIKNDVGAVLGVAEIEAMIEEKHSSAVSLQSEKIAAEAELAVANVADASAKQRSSLARAEVARINEAIAAAKSNMQALVRLWKSAGVSGDPDLTVLEARRANLTRAAADLAAIIKEQSEVAAAGEAAAQRQDLAELVTWMESEAGKGAAEVPTKYEAEIKATLAKHKEDLALTKSTKNAVKAYSERLKKQAADFSSKFLVPLNNMIDNFNQALLTTPGESVNFNAATNVVKTKLDMALKYRDEIDEAMFDTTLPPQIVLSEGQMAANGFSILCAASTAYPWSRWPALLLDDPLQHNDIIHAAAFADVMRNLVELKGYQLIMSSHDRAEGEYFARKFDAAKLPCTVVTLTAPSRDGVMFDPPRYNEAAQKLVAQEVSLTG